MQHRGRPFDSYNEANFGALTQINSEDEGVINGTDMIETYVHNDGEVFIIVSEEFELNLAPAIS